jgi:hypothetical protein
VPECRFLRGGADFLLLVDDLGGLVLRLLRDR